MKITLLVLLVIVERKLRIAESKKTINMRSENKENRKQIES